MEIGNYINPITITATVIGVGASWLIYRDIRWDKQLRQYFKEVKESQLEKMTSEEKRKFIERADKKFPLIF